MIGQQIKTPDIIEKVTAYRTWDLLDNKLIPLNRISYTWSADKQIAGCQSPYGEYKDACKESPSHDCSCGLYGFFDKNKAIQQSLGVVGVTEHWGKTEIHQDGLRSQYAQIKALAYAPINKKCTSYYGRSMLRTVMYILRLLTQLIFISALILTLLKIIMGIVGVESFSNYSIIGLLLYITILGVAAVYSLGIFIIFGMSISRKKLITKIDWKIFLQGFKDKFISEKKKKQQLKDFCFQHNIIYVDDHQKLDKFCNSQITKDCFDKEFIHI